MRKRAPVALLMVVLMVVSGLVISSQATRAQGTALALKNAQLTPFDVALEQGAFTRSGNARLFRSDYQYETIGLGGTTMRVGPHGFTIPGAPAIPGGGHLDYRPYLAYEYWWNEKGHRLTPFELIGGYGDSIDAGTIQSFSHLLSIEDGTLKIDLGLRVEQFSFETAREMFVTPDGVLVVRIQDKGNHTLPFRMQIQGNDGWRTQTLKADARGFVVSAEQPGAAIATLAVVADHPSIYVDRDSQVIGENRRISGATITLYIAPGSSYASQDPVESAWKRANDARNAGFDTLKQETAQWWEAFYARSTVDLPEKDLAIWYARSLYYHGVYFGNTRIPPGMYGTSPAIYWGSIWPEFDLVYSHVAMLYTNRFDEARNIVDWLYGTLPKARENALGANLYDTYVQYSGGAKYGWAVGYDGTIIQPPSPREVFNLYSNYPNANVAYMALSYADWTLDPRYEEIALEILHDTTQVSVEDLAWRSYLGAFLDRNKSDILQQEAAIYLLSESVRRGVGPDAWRLIARQVYRPRGIFRGKDVIVGWAGESPGENYGDAPWLQGVWWYGTLPADDPIVKASFDLFSTSNTKYYVFNRGMMSVVASKLRQPDEAHSWARSLLNDDVIYDDTNMIEMIWDWEDFKRTPEIAAHGALIASITQMLVDPDQSDAITVFPGVPNHWFDIGFSFNDLSVRGGLLVSAAVESDLIKVSVENTSTQTQMRDIHIRVPHVDDEEAQDEWVIIPDVAIEPQERFETTHVVEGVGKGSSSLVADIPEEEVLNLTTIHEQDFRDKKSVDQAWTAGDWRLTNSGLQAPNTDDAWTFAPIPKVDLGPDRPVGAIAVDLYYRPTQTTDAWFSLLLYDESGDEVSIIVWRTPNSESRSTQVEIAAKVSDQWIPLIAQPSFFTDLPDRSQHLRLVIHSDGSIRLYHDDVEVASYQSDASWTASYHQIGLFSRYAHNPYTFERLAVSVHDRSDRR